MIRVLLVDDQNVLRAGLRGILETAGDIEICGEARNGRDALAMMQMLRPEVVLLDLRMPVMDGFATLAKARSDPNYDMVRFLVLTTFEDEDNVLTAIQLGANGFIGKTIEPDELIDAVRATALGDAELSQSAVRALMRQARQSRVRPLPDPNDVARLATLTDRERDVVLKVAEGLSNVTIGETLFISPVTVKTHLNRAMVKLGASDRAQVVLFVHRAGLLEI